MKIWPARIEQKVFIGTAGRLLASLGTHAMRSPKSLKNHKNLAQKVSTGAAGRPIGCQSVLRHYILGLHENPHNSMKISPGKIFLANCCIEVEGVGGKGGSL